MNGSAPTFGSRSGLRAVSPIAVWDGVGDTVPAYPPLGPVWRPGAGPEPVPNAGRPAAFDLAGRRYQVAFNRWLWAVRAPGAPSLR